jgi:hypothetical protein
MVGMEDTMRLIQKDGAEIRLMRRGLDAGLAKAKTVLDETKHRYYIIVYKDIHSVFTHLYFYIIDLV